MDKGRNFSEMSDSLRNLNLKFEYFQDVHAGISARH